MPYRDRNKARECRKRSHKRRMQDPIRREKHLQQVRVSVRKWKAADPRRSLLVSAKERAKKFHVPINITLDDIVIPEYCPVFPDLKLVRNAAYGKDNSPTLDRIRPALGYVKGNIAVISFRANRLKSDATIEDFARLLSYLLKTVP